MTEKHEMRSLEAVESCKESLADKACAIAHTLMRARILRYGTSYNASERKESFADFLEQATKRKIDGEMSWSEGLIGELVRDLQKEGVEASYDELSAHVNEQYVGGGVEGVSKYLYTWTDLLHGKEEGTSTAVYFNFDEENEAYSFLSTATGYVPDGAFMQVHLKPKYLYTGESYLAQIQKDFGEVARSIVCEYPETQAVVAESWLMDTSIARRMKFTVVPGYTNTSDSGSWRMQLIKMDGTIDEKVLQTYIEGDELPYKVCFGHISVKDFLYEYLPTEFRDTPITLRTINPAYKEMLSCLRDERTQFSKILSEDWDAVVGKTLSVKDLLSRISTEAPHLFRFFEEYALRSEVEGILYELSKHDVTYAEIDALHAKHPELAKRIAEYRTKEKNALRSVMYQDEVFDLASYVPATRMGTALIPEKVLGHKPD